MDGETDPSVIRDFYKLLFRKNYHHISEIYRTLRSMKSIDLYNIGLETYVYNSYNVYLRTADRGNRKTDVYVIMRVYLQNGRWEYVIVE